MRVSISAILLFIFILSSCSKKNNNPVSTDNPADTTANPVDNRPVVLLSFSPEYGSYDTKVTIKCLNLDGDKKKNEVYFNNIRAGISWIDSTNRSEYIVAYVPKGATTGKIKVVRGNYQDESLKDFVVTDKNTLLPQVYRLTHLSGIGSSLDTIIGKNFGYSINDTRVLIGEAESDIVSVNDTSIIFKVPCYADPGPVKVAIKEIVVNSGIIFNALKFSLAWIEMKDIKVKINYRDSALTVFSSNNIPVSSENNGTYNFFLNLGGGSRITMYFTPDCSQQTINATVDNYIYFGYDEKNARTEYEETIMTLENMPYRQVSENIYIAEAKGSQLQNVIKNISHEYKKNPTYTKDSYTISSFTESSVIRITMVLCNE